MKSYKPGQLVYINLKTRKIESAIISEDPKKKGFYFLDWTISGRNEILNTVSIISSAITPRRMKKIRNDNFVKQEINM